MWESCLIIDICSFEMLFKGLLVFWKKRFPWCTNVNPNLGWNLNIQETMTNMRLNINTCLNTFDTRFDMVDQRMEQLEDRINQIERHQEQWLYSECVIVIFHVEHYYSCHLFFMCYWTLLFNIPSMHLKCVLYFAIIKIRLN